jgi:hypothetical protein
MAPGLLMPDTHDIVAEYGGRGGVVGVVMGVDEVRHRAADILGCGDLVHGPLQVVADARGASNSTTPSGVVRNADW